jgi:hypothetical protein
MVDDEDFNKRFRDSSLSPNSCATGADAAL